MLFNSQIFIFGFLPVVLGVYYYFAECRTCRQITVILASLVFYGYWDVRFVPLLAGLTVANWLIVRLFGRYWQIWILDLGIAMNLGTLAVFKYANFLADNFSAVTGIPHDHWGIVIPLGISFFVFQKISYLVDLRRGDPRIYGFLDFCMFVLFFPQLIAGPIVRHNEIISQFEASPRGPTMWENLSRGLVLFLCGLIKKVAIADTVAKISDPLFAKAAHDMLSATEAWTAAGSYALQIYFDFSGYSDMAIGLGLMFGLRLPFNFDAPYRSLSIREFWRRWHMTLSRILRDYLYIPLGGNRRGPVRQAINVMLTMLLGGLWHGANWTFVVWGGCHGAALAACGLWQRQGWRMPRPLAWAATMLFVTVAWVLFRSPDFHTALGVLSMMTDLRHIDAIKIENWWVAAIGAGLALLGPTSQRLSLELLPPRAMVAVTSAITMVLLLILIGGGLQNEFIYFQF